MTTLLNLFNYIESIRNRITITSNTFDPFHFIPTFEWKSPSMKWESSMCQIIFERYIHRYIVKKDILHGGARIPHQNTWRKQWIFNQNVPNCYIFKVCTTLRRTLYCPNRVIKVTISSQ